MISQALLWTGLVTKVLDPSFIMHSPVDTRRYWASHIVLLLWRFPNSRHVLLRKNPNVSFCSLINFLSLFLNNWCDIDVFFLYFLFPYFLFFFLCLLEVFEAARSSMLAFKKWRQGGSRLEKASILGRKRKTTIPTCPSTPWPSFSSLTNRQFPWLLFPFNGFSFLNHESRTVNFSGWCNTKKLKLAHCGFYMQVQCMLL